jgi:hypothetical protein
MPATMAAPTNRTIFTRPVPFFPFLVRLRESYVLPAFLQAICISFLEGAKTWMAAVSAATHKF